MLYFYKGDINNNKIYKKSGFDKIAKLYDSFFVQFYYYWAHRKSIKFIKDYLKNNEQILDIACGTGNFLKKLKKINKDLRLFGVDESEEMVKIAKNKSQTIKFSVNIAEKLPFQEDSFDLITIIDAFYYFKNKEKVIHECRRALKQNGYLFIFTPVCDNFFQKFLLEYIGRISGVIVWFYDIEKRSKHLSLRELNSLTKKSDFKLVKTDIKFWQRMIIFQKK